MLELNKIYNMDCMKGMKEIEDNSIDLVLTDPPYNVIGNMQKWDDKGSIKEFMFFTKSWLDECYRVLKQDTACYVFFGQKFIKDFYNLKTDFELKRMLIWHHPNLAKITNKMYLWTYDPIFYLIKGKPVFKARFSQRENVDVFRIAKPQTSFKGDMYRYHPASKPVELVKKLIAPTTKTEDIVLDPFMGGGTTAVAARKLSRQFIGFEESKEYCDISEKRLKTIPEGLHKWATPSLA